MTTRFYYTIICCAMLCFSNVVNAQSIRKDYREFTSQEMSDYVAALGILFSNGTITAFANAHSMHGVSPIHTVGGFTGEQFLPWHRFFLIDMEERLRGTNSNYAYLSIPYWNWTTDQNSSASQFWNNGFLNLSNFSGWGITRSIGGSLPTPTDMTNTLNLTTFFINTTAKGPTSTDLAHRWEHYHDIVHVWVGGTMGSIPTAPRDPIFYLHHSMVDMGWQNWEDKTTSIQSSFPTGTTPMVHYSVADGYAFNVTANMMVDSRNTPRPAFSGSGRNPDVWYAENGKVLLDGANGSAFVASDAAASYVYRYTAATSPGSSSFGGSIYVGDIQLDGSGNVIDDSKGGFEVNSSVKCNFLAGSAIIFRNGFWAKSGSQMVAKIISSPNETAPLRSKAEPTAMELMADADHDDAPGDIKLFPNPVREKAVVRYSLTERGQVSVILVDMNGRIMQIIENGLKDPGNYTTEINTAALAGGTYLCRVSVKGQTRVFKLLKQ